MYVCRAGLREWVGAFSDLPAYMGPADVAVLDVQPLLPDAPAVRAALLKASLSVKHGGRVIVNSDSDIPQAELDVFLAGLPLRVCGASSAAPAAASRLLVLQVPLHYALPSPVRLEGPVVTGFGRGSRQLGVPTANIDPAPLASTLAAMPLGVYFGWAQLTPPSGWPAADSQVHSMVMNVGKRPTVTEAGTCAAWLFPASHACYCHHAR